ncbi:replication protein A 70 kDa DNA-binding subunit D-like [Daucus carota subsp. sativus]|uniref:replication protein A 70 kDa DNA-binding subunit D-like n=1 Tax=Daucus carota subsp. sativus TaxID=79200 RepID=UPI003083D7A0
MDMAINFFYKTKIEEAEDNKIIPQYKFEIHPFDKVQGLVGQIKNLIDVVGMVTSVGRLEKRTNGAEKLDVALTDSRNEKMIVTLWEDRAYQFQASLQNTGQSPIFVVITGLLAKKFSDKPSLSSTDATRTYFDIDYKPLKDLKNALHEASAKAGVGLLPPTNVQFVTADEKSVQQLHIKDVLDIEIPPEKDQVRGLCMATITEIMEGNGWLYNCCSKCARAVHPTEEKYFCVACNDDNITVSQRYRVVARIKDDTGTTTVTLFNKEAEQLIGAPIQRLINELTEGTNMEEIPPAVKNIVGKLCAFQIKINNYNITNGCEEYTVTRVSECSNAEAGGSDTVNAGHKDKRVRLE